MNRQITPSEIGAPVAAYAHAILSESPSRLLHSSGVVPVRRDGTVPEGLAEQAGQVWANISAILSGADMAPQDIVSVTTYAVVGEDLGPIMAARDAFLDGHLAASTLVTVPALAQPAWRVEIAIVAAD